MSIMRLVFLLSLAAGSAIAAPIIEKRQESKSIEFGYEGNSGPNFWPDQCQNTDPGQSPIDLREGSADLVADPLEADLPTQENCELHNSGHDLQVTLDPAAPKMSFVPSGQDESFEVQGFHFHSPSEHHIKGKYFDAEMHMVGKSPSGTTGVLAVFFEVSPTPQEGNIISVMAQNFPLPSCGAKVPLPAIDFSTVLEATNNLTSFFSYTGSLTTPPCTTGVLWSVMESPVPISVEDVLAVRNELVFSARFTQVARDEEPVFTPPKKEEEGECEEVSADDAGVEEPATEPATAEPSTGEPSTGEPCGEEVPIGEAPGGDVPVEEVPGELAEEVPIEEAPRGDVPVEEVPGEPAADTPADAPAEPSAEVPPEETPEETAAEIPAEPAAEEPPCETPTAEIPAEPAAEVPAEPAAEEPPCETPTAEKPPPDEPVSEGTPCETLEVEAAKEEESATAEMPAEEEMPAKKEKKW